MGPEDEIAKALEEISQIDKKKQLKESNKKKHQEGQEQHPDLEAKSKITTIENEVASVKMESSLIEDRSNSESPVTEPVSELGLGETVTESEIAVVHMDTSDVRKVKATSSA